MLKIIQKILFISFFVVLLINHAVAEDQKKFYDPVLKKLEGWTIKVDPKLLEGEHKKFKSDVFSALANHLQRIKYILTEERVKELQQLPIWLDFHYEPLGNMQYHPGETWLRANRHDPRLVKHVHIPRAKALLSRGQWAKHPYVILHELAHAYHDQILEKGFQNKEILEAYNRVKSEGIYDKVLLYTGRTVKHYALTTQMEYFAESTEAYLGVNDFYPFVRAELKEHDPRMFNILKKIWGEIK
ncbi:MAG: metallopeptidase [Verrucomicrobiales bacterium]|nr:metallopeptidase [Verrucomicrobiales bacterium]